MKKNYETPAVEVVEFNYSDQVVASSTGTNTCTARYINFKNDDGACGDPTTWKYYD